MYLCLDLYLYLCVFILRCLCWFYCCCYCSKMPDDLLCISLNVVISSYIVRYLCCATNGDKWLADINKNGADAKMFPLRKSLFHHNDSVCAEKHMHQHFTPNEFACQTIMNHRFVRLLDAHLALSVCQKAYQWSGWFIFCCVFLFQLTNQKHLH